MKPLITLAQPSLNKVAGFPEASVRVNSCPASAYTLFTFIPWTKHVTAAKSRTGVGWNWIDSCKPEGDPWELPIK